MLVDAWYRGSPWLIALKPLAALFRWQAISRREAYLSGKKSAWHAPVPVIVVGNITAGGVGKTPLVSAIVKWARDAGFKPGIVSRGYGGKAPRYPFSVTPDCEAAHAGDEPLMLARRCHCPVVVDANRVAAVKYLLSQHDCDLVISDDGMQHYALGRDMEIAVVDGQRGLGNQAFLPAGPLREPASRLQTVDWVIVNGEGFTIEDKMQRMQLRPAELVQLTTGAAKKVDALADTGTVHALAGIGNPQRFFYTLKQLGYQVVPHAFADHHVFKKEDLPLEDGKDIIMTEKDAVKCTAIADDRCWYLTVEPELDSAFIETFQRQLKDLAGLKKLKKPDAED